MARKFWELNCINTMSSWVHALGWRGPPNKKHLPTSLHVDVFVKVQCLLWLESQQYTSPGKELQATRNRVSLFGGEESPSPSLA